MRLCRFELAGQKQVGFYLDGPADGSLTTELNAPAVLPLSVVASRIAAALPDDRPLPEYLPGGKLRGELLRLQESLAGVKLDQWEDGAIPVGSSGNEARLLVPVPNPGKLLLLAGNYTKHIEEGGGQAEEREKTFPYVFMKPPATTLTHPGDPVQIPSVSPNEIDWEIELGVIIGRTCRAVSEADALDYVAGYTVVNDISDRAFTPNPQRNQRPKDQFFDWLHGKWHDTFCPMGPCVLPADELSDPQQFELTLTLNGHVEQSGSTSQMVFSVAAVIAFISSFVTLHPGDIISTGTPHGVGKAKGKFLKTGDLMHATISNIGTLTSPVQ